MSDAGRNTFERRLARIDTIHAEGGAFEAEGTLGRQWYDSHRRKQRKALPFRAIAMLFIGALLFKGALLAEIGPERYNGRVSALANGSTVEQVGAWALQADAPTQWIAGQLRAALY
ncbi:hypothetical protein SAMN05877809_10854 [Rhodobacter sp. JA431]|uniref:hypothetical protein n=1 Tax=Rhodobacter sp. JA431 TaxID=570013 RepID=UPI000BD36BB8|nr:hypothetical protein [Rhodobacter sp. JA431]SOC15769.1 hypothetical protein SAMN05877809_10854 [Rhodobacter sp. JA431]